jgi:hypothetical protein
LSEIRKEKLDESSHEPVKMIRTVTPNTLGRNVTPEDVKAIQNGLKTVVGYTELHPEIVNQIKENKK